MEENLKEIQLIKEHITKEIEELNKLQYRVYNNILKENGLDNDVELSVWNRNKLEFKKGRILIVKRYKGITPYIFEFHSYTKKGELSLNQLGYIGTVETLTRKLKLEELRKAKEVDEKEDNYG